jgi:hypothetical protein
MTNSGPISFRASYRPPGRVFIVVEFDEDVRRFSVKPDDE